MVTPDGLREALIRQGESGGSLDTALLELGLVTEDRLMGALSRSSGLPAAPLSVYQQLDARARRVFPSKVAERHGFAPFALEGRELSLVATCPVDLGLLDEVSFMLSLHLTPHVGPEWRVRSLIQRLYGGALSPRLSHLADLAAARGTSPGVAAASLPLPEARDSTPEPEPEPEAEAPAPAIYLGSSMPAISESPERPGRPGPTRPPPGLVGFTRADGEPLEPLAAALAEALEASDIDGPEAAGDAPAEVPAGADAGEAPAGATPGPDGGDAAGLLGAEPAVAPEDLDRSAPPRWTLEQARAVLAKARTRDEVVVTVLRYARDFFKFAALFAVTRDAVAGHDAIGPDGDARDLARTVAIYADDPGVFRTAIETMAPYLGRVDRAAPGNQVVLDGLGRGSPRTVLVTPLLLRSRPVCLLYGDNAGAPVSARRLGDLLLFCSTVGSAFERIIKTRKGDLPGRAGRPRVEPAPPQPAGAGPPPAELPPQAPPPAEPMPEEAPLPEAAAGPPAPADPIAAVEAPPPLEIEIAIAEPPPPVAGLFERREPAWRGPSGIAKQVSAAEAEFFASGGLLEPEELFTRPSPPPGLPPLPPPSDEPPLEASNAPGAPPPEPERLPPEPPDPAVPGGAVSGPATAAPRPGPPEPPGLPDDPAYLVGAYLTADAGSPARADLLARLVGHAAAAAPILCEMLPGPIEVAAEALAATPAAAQGPVFKALAAMGPPAVPSLLAVLGDAAPIRRRAAVALLGAIGDPAGLTPLADRCLDADLEVAQAAREALVVHRGTPALRPVPERLRRALSSGLTVRAGLAARALSALRDVESIPNLIQALDGTDPTTAAASAEALAAITLQRHGSDPRRWLLWWKANRGRGRAEWLFGGLSAEDREVRAAAAAELAQIAPPPVPYSPDMIPAEREPAARAWAGWFTRSGYRV